VHVSRSRPAYVRPTFNAGTRNRRYAAVLSHLNKQTGTGSQLSSSAFSGYVPKCKQNSTERCERSATTSVASRSAEQHRTKVSFCLQSHQGDTLRERKRTASSFKRVVSASSSPGASATSVTLTCNEAMASTTASLPSLTTASNSELSASDIPCVQMPADSSDISLLCAELFVANNASFCDQLLESCPLPQEPLKAAIPVPGSSSCSLKTDIPEPISDFVFDDFVEFEFFGCN